MKAGAAWLALAGFGLLLGGCFEFEASLKASARHFEQTHPDGFQQAVVDGRPVRWAQAGDPAKPRVLFIHGSPGGWDAWAAFLEDPALLAMACLAAPDRLGYGGSCKGCVVASLQDQAAALLPILEGSGPAIIVGHSLGGPIAVRLAMDHPDKVAALVLVAPSIDPAQEQVHWYQSLAAGLRWILPSDLDVCNREIMPLKGELEAMTPLWPKVTMPVELIQGLADPLVPPANADYAERVLPHGNLHVLRVPGMNHFVPWQHPDLVRAAILRRLAALPVPVTR